MMTCRQATRLASEEMDRALAGSERFALKLHTLLCVGCRHYRQQLSFIRQACRHESAGDEQDSPPPPSAID